MLQSDITILVIAASVWTAVIFIGGIVLGAWLESSKRKPLRAPIYADDDEERTIKVKRNKPSLRNPMRTYDTRYDDFRTSRDLYAPVHPKGGRRQDEDRRRKDEDDDLEE